VVNSKAVGWLAGKIQRREEKGKEKKKEKNLKIII